tara:strand:+ start:57 stop:710 length:654 start_codon:yes stop_codon:yes gene_type:complete
MKKSFIIHSYLIFIIPFVTLSICYILNVIHYDLASIPFIDGKVSVSQVGRQEKTIFIFRTGFMIYSLTSIYYYYKVTKIFSNNHLSYNFYYFSIFANAFLIIYLICLGKNEIPFNYIRRFSIISFILLMFVIHILKTKNLLMIRNNNSLNLNTIYLFFILIIIFIMSLLIIIGSPWVNPFFEYPNKLKNIVEWNFFLMMIAYYVPFGLVFKKNNSYN